LFPKKKNKSGNNLRKEEQNGTDRVKLNRIQLGRFSKSVFIAFHLLIKNLSLKKVGGSVVVVALAVFDKLLDYVLYQ